MNTNSKLTILNRLLSIIIVILIAVLAIITVISLNNSNSNSSDENTTKEITTTLTAQTQEPEESYKPMEELRKPTRFPIALKEVEISKTPFGVIIDYYYEDDYYLTYRQRPLGMYDFSDNIKNYTITKIDINGYEGTMAVYPPSSQVNFYWSDAEYAYSLNTHMFTSDEILEIAKSLTTFDDNLSEHPITEEITTEIIINRPNDIIKEVKKPSWVPDGIEEFEIMNNQGFVVLEYCSGDKYCFCYVQSPIANEDIHVDNEGATVTLVNINGLSGTFITYSTDSRINLFWNDDDYIYQVWSETLTSEEVIKVAESVK